MTLDSGYFGLTNANNLCQQGQDTIYGDGGNDDIYGGHAVVGGRDNGDILHGGDDEDTILGDNGQIVRQRLSINGDDPWVQGMQWLTYASPFDSEVVRDVRRYDDIDYIQVGMSSWSGALVFVCALLHFLIRLFHFQQGDDSIYGDNGADTLHGQRGDDRKFQRSRFFSLSSCTNISPPLFALCRFSDRWRARRRR